MEVAVEAGYSAVEAGYSAVAAGGSAVAAGGSAVAAGGSAAEAGYSAVDSGGSPGAHTWRIIGLLLASLLISSMVALSSLMVIEVV